MDKNKALHEKLGITFAELGALYGTRAMLIAKDLVHTPNTEVCPHPHMINMSVPWYVRDCGTLGCIGGNMAIIMGRGNPNSIREYVINSCGTLHALFYPDDNTTLKQNNFIGKWDKFTADQMVKAIDNFLAGARFPWAGIAYKVAKKVAKKVANKKRTKGH